MAHEVEAAERARRRRRRRREAGARARRRVSGAQKGASEEKRRRRRQRARSGPAPRVLRALTSPRRPPPRPRRPSTAPRRRCRIARRRRRRRRAPAAAPRAGGSPPAAAARSGSGAEGERRPPRGAAAARFAPQVSLVSGGEGRRQRGGAIGRGTTRGGARHDHYPSPWKGTPYEYAMLTPQSDRRQATARIVDARPAARRPRARGAAGRRPPAPAPRRRRRGGGSVWPAWAARRGGAHAELGAARAPAACRRPWASSTPRCQRRGRAERRRWRRRRPRARALYVGATAGRLRAASRWPQSASAMLTGGLGAGLTWAISASAPRRRRSPQSVRRIGVGDDGRRGRPRWKHEHPGVAPWRDAGVAGDAAAARRHRRERRLRRRSRRRRVAGDGGRVEGEASRDRWPHDASSRSRPPRASTSRSSSGTA